MATGAGEGQERGDTELSALRTSGLEDGADDGDDEGDMCDRMSDSPVAR